ncbi:MAG: ABC transporter permease [Actinobacteria bacterium]|nr:ABC transporter permease [Actinomycetota bacterium]
MIRVFLAESRKLRRPGLFVGTMAAVIGVSALVTSLLFLLIDSARGNGRAGELVTRASLELPQGISVGFSGSAGLLGLVALCVFASQTAQEYSYGTLRNLLVRQPRRLTLLLGKFLAMNLFALLSVIFSAIVSVSLAYALSGKAKVSTAAWSTSDARISLIHTFINVFISVIAYGTIGMILGLLLRSPISSISIGVGWLLVVESIIAATVKNSGKWMPGQLMNSIASGGDFNASYSHAITVLFAYLVVGVTLVSVLFRRRDVAN